MPINPKTGAWQPNLNAKQTELFNAYDRYLLVSGPRYSSKTIGCLHRILRHAFETPHARIAMFAKTVKSAHSGGVWSDLLETCLPEWLDANIGMRITVGPKVDGATRMHYVGISNAFGNESRIQLHSLDYDHDIEAAVKGMRFSLVYFSELSNFRNRIVFDATTAQMRMPHLTFEEHQWIGDTNPSDEGDQSWIYRLFWGERTREDDQRIEYKAFQRNLRVLEIFIEDNIFLDEQTKQDIIARYSHDVDLYNRYVKGLWTTSTKDGHFSDVFRYDTHVLGDVGHVDEAQWELLLPSDDCSTMITGWDTGQRNHSVHILEKIVSGELTHFHVLDEIVAIDSDMSLGDFVEYVMARIEFWENYVRKKCHTKPIQWTHWSDQSAFDQFRSNLANYDHQTIAVESDGKILLRAAPKGKNSVMKRVDITQRLLFEQRLYISACCSKTVQMFRSLKKGKTKIEYVERSPHIHVFDSLSYALSAECYFEIVENYVPKLAPAGEPIGVRLL